MKVKDLRPAPYNPRKISEEKLRLLGTAMRRFGDLSGIVFNKRTGNIVGGHQRVKQFDPSWEVAKKSAKDDLGTVAVGFVETPFGRWTYREVDWDPKKEAAANIAANKHGGDFSIPLLKEIITEIDDGAFDMELLGFESLEFEKLFSTNSKPATEKKTCPSCGYEW